MHHKTITMLLNIPEINVIKVLEIHGDDIHLEVEPADASKPALCSHCGAVHSSVHSRGRMSVEDLPLSGKRVFLYLEKRKCRCPDGSIHVEYLPWLHGRFTRRFAKQINRLTAITTNSEAGWFFGLDDEVVYRI